MGAAAEMGAVALATEVAEVATGMAGTGRVVATAGATGMAAVEEMVGETATARQGQVTTARPRHRRMLPRMAGA